MASPLAVMAYVANNDPNELLVTTSTDGIHWSDARSVYENRYHRSQYAPALAVLGDHLVLVFDTGSKILDYCVSTDGVNWSSRYQVAWYYDWGDPYYPSDKDQAWQAGRVVAETRTAPTLVAYRSEADNQIYLFYVSTRWSDELWYSAAKMRGRSHIDGPVAFGKSFPAQVWTRDPTTDRYPRQLPNEIVDLSTTRRAAVAVVNGTFVMAYAYYSSLMFSTSTDGKVWVLPQKIMDKSGEPAITVLNDTAIVGWRYEDGSNRLAVAPIRDVGKPDKKPSLGEITAVGEWIPELSKYGPALTNLGGKLVLAFVAANETNELLTSISIDGVEWLPNQPTGHNSKMAPALATFYPKSG